MALQSWILQLEQALFRTLLGNIHPVCKILNMIMYTRQFIQGQNFVLLKGDKLSDMVNVSENSSFFLASINEENMTVYL